MYKQEFILPWRLFNLKRHSLKSGLFTFGVTAALILCAASFSAHAQPAKRPAQSSLEGSKKVKFKDKTEINFDAANIDGQVKNPFGTMVTDRDQDFNKGFIKLRYHWHDQMIMSVSGLSQ